MPARFAMRSSWLRQERRVGRNHDDDRAIVAVHGGFVAVGAPAQVLAYRNSGDPQRRAGAVVSLYQRAHRIGVALHLDLARGRADAALEAVTGHAGAAADAAFLDRPALRAVECRVDMRRLHVEAVDVVEAAVPGLGDDRRRPPVAGRVRVAVLHPPGDRRLVHGADAVRVGEHHRALEHPGLLDPGAPGHLARAVQHEAAGERRRRDRRAPARQDCRHAGAHLAAVGEVLDQRDLADRHAGHVGDRVEGAGTSFERHAEVAGPGVGVGDGDCDCRKNYQDTTEHAEFDGQMPQPRRNPCRHRYLGASC